MLAGFGGVVSAEENYTTGVVPINYTDEFLSVTEQIALIQQNPNLSQSEKDFFIKKLLAGNPKETKDLVGSVSSKYLSVPYYNQELGYYCGPAATKQTMQFLTGSSATLGQLASSLNTTTSGTNLSDMVNYINARVSSSKNYTIKYFTTSMTRLDVDRLLYTSIVEYGMTPIINVKPSTSYGWPYGVDGHFVNISGFRTEGNNYIYQVTDPFYVGHKNPTGKYEVTSEGIYRSILNQSNRRMAY